MFLVSFKEYRPKSVCRRGKHSLPFMGFCQLHDYIIWRQGVVLAPECLAKNAFDPISVDRPPGLSSSDDEAQSGAVRSVRHRVNPKGSIANVKGPVLQDAIELTLFCEAVGARQPH